MVLNHQSGDKLFIFYSSLHRKENVSDALLTPSMFLALMAIKMKASMD